MRSSIVLWAVCFLVGVSTGGCAHTQLRWNTVRQSRTLTDIYEQQVLDNLAMFAYDRGSLPFFSFPNAGASNVNDQGQVSTMLSWMRGVPGLNEGTLGLNGSRSMEESWTLTPLVDPIKLQLMRCAYQQVVTGGLMPLDCPDCQKMRDEFLGKAPKAESATGGPTVAPHCLTEETIATPPADGAAALMEVANTGTGQSQSDPGFPGAVTTDCLQPGWIGHGCKKCVPKHCKCLKVGHYCGVYVWVLPGGQDQLTKLTLNILNYAYNDPVPGATKQVTWYLDAAGNASTSRDASIVAQAVIPLSADVIPEPAGRKNLQAADSSNTDAQSGLWGGKFFQRIEAAPARPQPSWIPNANYLQFQQNLRFLAPTR